MRLNKHVRDVIKAENYLLFKHFLREFNMLNDRLIRSDIPALASIQDLLRENFLLKSTPMTDLSPFGFFTDGGTYNDDTKYFINNIFSSSGVCYSTKVPTNANVQFYLGRPVEGEQSKFLPKDHKVKGQANMI